MTALKKHEKKYIHVRRNVFINGFYFLICQALFLIIGYCFEATIDYFNPPPPMPLFMLPAVTLLGLSSLAFFVVSLYFLHETIFGD